MNLIIPSILSLVSIIFYCFPGTEALFQFNRQLIVNGEYWRLFTCHFTHCSFNHLLWDTLTFAVLSFLYCKRNYFEYLTMLFSSALFISLYIFFFVPEVTLYRGLSGIDTFLFCMISYHIVKNSVSSKNTRKAFLGILLLLLPVIKTSYEYISGNLIFASKDSFIPLPAAHFAGIILCFIIMAFYLLKKFSLFLKYSQI